MDIYEESDDEVQDIYLLGQQIKNMQSLLNLKIEELRSNCSHPKNSLVKESAYYSGGYDYKSESHSWMKCNRCGTTFDKKITYGSFE